MCGKENHPSTVVPLKEFFASAFSSQEHKKYHGLGELDAKLKYTQLCRSLRTYGVTFFLVKVTKIDGGSSRDLDRRIFLGKNVWKKQTCSTSSRCDERIDRSGGRENKRCKCPNTAVKICSNHPLLSFSFWKSGHWLMSSDGQLRRTPSHW